MGRNTVRSTSGHGRRSASGCWGLILPSGTNVSANCGVLFSFFAFTSAQRVTLPTYCPGSNVVTMMLLSKGKSEGEWLSSRFGKRGHEVIEGILRAGTRHFDLFGQAMPVFGIPGCRVGRVEQTGGTASSFPLGLGFASLGIDLDLEASKEAHVTPAVGQVPGLFVHGGHEAVVVRTQGVRLRLDLRVAESKRPHAALIANAVEEIEQGSPFLKSRVVSPLKTQESFFAPVALVRVRADVLVAEAFQAIHRVEDERLVGMVLYKEGPER